MRLLLVLFTSLCALSVSGLLHAQEVIEQRSSTLLASSNKVIDLPQADLHALTVTWRTGATPTQLRYRFTDGSKRYGEWQSWSTDNHAADVNAAALLTLPGTARRIEIDLDAGHEAKLLTKAYRADIRRGTAIGQLAATACPCPSPAVIERATWCTTGDCVPAGTPTALSPEHLIVHHSGTDVDGLDYALVVKAIYDYHTGTNGWDDIGYHLLVAPDGTVYQGRDMSRQGAHFCAANAGTLGVCVLGDYRTQALPAAAVDALARLGSFVSCEFDIEPLAESEHTPSGKTLFGVAAHRDGCATECPGDQLAHLMPTLRSAIDSRSSAGCRTIAAPMGLSAGTLTDGRVRLTWEAYAGAEQVLIERSTNDPNNFAYVATIDGASWEYRDNAATAGAQFYRIRVLVDGELSEYSETATANVSVSESTPPPATSPRLRRNPVRGVIEVMGLQAPVDQAFISDATGRTVKELKGTQARWSLQPGSLAKGRYWIIIFSGNEWYSVPFDYQP